jgi:cation diffusion facilitator family transporter
MMRRKSHVTIERVGWYSVGINILLTLLNLAISLASGSLAVAAEMVHNLVDLMASVGVLVGLKLSQRKSRDFPYGMYKVENVVSAGIALLIFVTGYEIAHQALFAKEMPITVSAWMVGGVILSMLVPMAFSWYEMRVARAANSPSLMASAQEYRVHVFSSGIVLVALVGRLAGLHLDRIAALVVVAFVLKTGWELLSDSMRMLLDASLDADTLAKARTIIEAQPGVVNVNSLTGRNAGRYRFLETEVALRVTDLERAHQISSAIDQAIREQVPYVERVLVHAEPAQKPVQRVALSLSDEQGTVSQHFGTAPYFALIDVRVTDGVRLRQNTMLNPHRAETKQRGLNVARWLLDEKVDVVITGDNVHDKSPAYVLDSAGVTLILTHAANLETALAEWQTGEGKLTTPTLRPDRGDQRDGGQDQAGAKGAI